MSETIARAQTMEENKRGAVYGMVSLLVVIQEVLHAATVLIFEVIAQALPMEVNGPTVVYGINSLTVVCQEALHVPWLNSEITAQAPMMRWMKWAAVVTLIRSAAGETQFIRYISSGSNSIKLEAHDMASGLNTKSRGVRLSQ